MERRAGVRYLSQMVKAVFIASSHSAYDDQPGRAYHFPNTYLSRVAQTLGDWVIFFQGRRGGTVGYYAVQKVEQIVPDPQDGTHSYAMLDVGSELSFERPVPRFRDDGRPYESGLPQSRGSNTSAVRVISESDFSAILTEGLRGDDVPDAIPRIDAAKSDDASGMFDPGAVFDFGLLAVRPRGSVLTSVPGQGIRASGAAGL